MGLGRREFLRLTGLALAGLTIDPLKAVAVNKNYYVNRKFGIILEKPDTWDFIALKDFGRLRDEQILPDQMEFTKEEIFEELGEPAFVITKYWQDTAAFKGKFSPTISAFINHKSELDFEYNSFEELIEFSGLGTGFLLKDFEQKGVTGPFLISNCKSYIREATYSFEHVDLKGSIKVNLKVVIIEHNDFYYFINMHDAAQVNESAQLEFDACIKTIRLV
jgi:hypothetical protein